MPSLEKAPPEQPRGAVSLISTITGGTTVDLGASGLTGALAEVIITMPDGSTHHHYDVPITAGAIPNRKITNAKAGSHKLEVKVNGVIQGTKTFTV